MDRRKTIIDIISNQDTPISATKLAKQTHVSRQIIVGDIALLRAQGYDIIATPKGYMMQDNGHTYIIAVKHNTNQTEDELNTIVDMGGIIEDVIVEHPIYGELKGNLHISSRRDVQQFIESSKNTSMLSSLTDGVHLHTIRCDEDIYQDIIQELDKKGYILKED